MSEIRRTEPVEAFEAPSSEPLISLSDVLAGVGRLAYHGAKLTVRGARLAYQGGSALARSIQESQRALTLPEIDTLIERSANNRDALEQLVATPALELPKAAAERWRSAFSVLAPDDKAGLRASLHQLVGERQERQQADLSQLAADCCRELGFTAATLRPEHGILVAKKGRESLTVVAEKRKDGGVSLHLDAEGFYGDACVRTLNAFHRKMEDRGVRFQVSSRRRKDDHRAIDGEGLIAVNRLRQRG